VEALDHPLLHAWLLAFDHPGTGERVRFTAPPPADFVEFCEAAKLPIPRVA
jgi:23S rRNA pseudouridine1911/1915/1917 synthase